MTVRQGLARRLRARGFRRVYPEDHDPVQYRLDDGVCFVIVQLWRDGGHRASSGADSHEDKTPTSFKTADEMLAAVEVEMAAAKAKLISEKFTHWRSSLIETHVRENYGFEDAGDIALDEMKQNPDRTWLDIAVTVAHRIGQP